MATGERQSVGFPVDSGFATADNREKELVLKKKVQKWTK